MTEALNELFEDPSNENVEEILEDHKTLERRNDICRAFAILLYHSNSSKSDEFQTEVSCKHILIYALFQQYKRFIKS